MFKVDKRRSANKSHIYCNSFVANFVSYMSA